MRGYDKKYAIEKARKESKKSGNRVYVFSVENPNQYYELGKYYVLEVGDDHSFDLGNKKEVWKYKNGKKRESIYY